MSTITTEKNNINWYPGHMKKTRELIRDNLKMVDLVIELLDARIPVSSRNPIINELVGDKQRIVVLNKSDLADPTETAKWRRYLSDHGTKTLEMNSMSGSGTKELLKLLESIESSLLKQRNAAASAGQGSTDAAGSDAANGKPANAAVRKRKPLRMMIVGIPNVGKSSLINRLTGKKSARTGDKPGVTKGKQWLTLSNGMQLLDTPGILWPKLEDPGTGLALAFCGSIKDEVLNIADLGLEFVKYMETEYPQLLISRYGIDEICETSLETMEAIAIKRGCILPGKRIDYDRVAKMMIDEFRSAAIGKITLEKVED